MHKAWIVLVFLFCTGFVMAGEVIVLDAGHGGKDPGAVINGVKEKDVNLAITLRLAEILTERGCTVILTRKDDTFLTLTQRTQIANEAKADLFVSIHANSAGNKSAHGVEVYHHSTRASARSVSLAGDICATLAQIADRSRGVKQANFLVLRKTKMPAVLVEVGFLSNFQEANKLRQVDYREKLAKAIADGIKPIKESLLASR